MLRHIVSVLVGMLLPAPLVVGNHAVSGQLHTQMVPTNGTSLYVRVGGKGPAAR